jgi:hypothetical protein
VQEEKVLEWWLTSRKLLHKHMRKVFDSLLPCWVDTLKGKNARTFSGQSSTPGHLALRIQDEANEWCLAGYRHLLSLLALL